MSSRVRPVTRLLVGCAALAALATVGPAPAQAQRPDQAHASADVVVYPGQGVDIWRHGHDLGKLKRTPTAFRGFIDARLDRLWRDLGGRAECGSSVLITVKQYGPRRYALLSNEGWFAHAGDPASCNAGGHYTIAAHWNGRWRAVLSGQDLLTCRELHRYRVPRTIGGPRCLDADGEPVRYR
ncbi:MAG TPA: hypothetical protein VFH10_08360 [Nocardioides sp.]|uniref:hypothetical protein n=1 Tax=Nocardioides sp. TaxID=35761 RepID=UPI002D80DE78|nr:hypothetical protein [Nocardioides sp.]HET6652638.1 hypothetical protein [Nocardioides sp.]